MVSTWIWQNSSASDNGALYAAFTHDSNGLPVTVWNQNVSTQNTQKARLATAASTGGFDMLAFGNGPSGSVDLKAVRANLATIPAIVTTVILNFILLWNELLYAVVLITDDSKRTSLPHDRASARISAP